MTTPSWGDLIPLQSDNWHDLPDVETPYYVEAKDGRYLHRRTAQGRGLVRTFKTPPNLKPIGDYSGTFTFIGEGIPAPIYAQAVSFFRRVYDTHHTEAEVIITQHRETKEYKLYVPTQRVSHGGVYSIYDPTTIDTNYLVVGTFHSHCDFSAFHSSTDEGDARDMDGIHGTVGYLNRDKPELALMYALNGKLFHFEAPFDEVVDTTNLEAATAPEWWDRYMVFATVTDKDRPAWADDESWERYMGRYKPKTTYQTPTTPQRKFSDLKSILTPEVRHQLGINFDFSDEDWGNWTYTPQTNSWKPAEPLKESRDFNENTRALVPYRNTDPTDKDLLPGGPAVDEETSDWWEDILGRDYVDSLFQTGLFTEDDLDMAVEHFPRSATNDFWENRFRGKMFHAANWLRDRGIDVQIQVRDKRIKPVPGQTTVEDQIQGAIG